MTNGVQYWWNVERKACVGIKVADGHYKTVSAASPSDCHQKAGHGGSSQQATSSADERVHLDKGSSGAELTGTLPPGESRRYRLHAKNGQNLYVRVAAKGPEIYYQVFNPDGSFLLDQMTSHKEYRGQLWQSGDHVVEVTPAEIDAYLARMAAVAERDRRERDARLAGIERQLAAPGPAEDRRTTLAAEREMLAQMGRDLDRGAVTPQETVEEVQVRRIIAAPFIRQWRINQALYREYGGRIVFQQGGPEPLDAYRRFLEDQQTRGAFAITMRLPLVQRPAHGQDCRAPGRSRNRKESGTGKEPRKEPGAKNRGPKNRKEPGKEPRKNRGQTTVSDPSRQTTVVCRRFCRPWGGA